MATARSLLKPLGPYLALTAAIAASFHNGVRGGFAFDDRLLLERLPCAREPRLALEGLLLAGGGDCAYRPLRFLSYAADHALFGTNPVGYHLTNLLLHTVTSGLVFALLMGLLAAGARGDARASKAIRFGAACGAVLFAIHPVQVDSVTYISGRRDVLHALIYVAALVCYLRYRTTRSRALGATIVPLYYLALQSKEMAITLPAVLLLVEAALEGASGGAVGAPARATTRPGPGLVRRLAGNARETLVACARPIGRHPWLYGSLFALGGTFLAYRAVLSPVTSQPGFWGGSRWANTATALGTLPGYARLVLWPETLMVDYSPDAYPVHVGMSAPLPLLGLLLALSFAGVTLLARRSAPMLALAAGWVLVTLLPVMHVVPHHELMAEHYLYLPLVGVTLAAADGLRRLYGRSWVVAAVLAPAIVLPLSVRTLVRNDDWATEWTLLEAQLRATDDCIRAHSNYAKLLWSHPERDAPGRTRLERHLKRALQLIHTPRPASPGVPRAPLLAMLGAVRVTQGHIDRGLALLRTAYAEAQANDKELPPFEQVADSYLVTLLNLGGSGQSELARKLLLEAVPVADEWLERTAAPARPLLLRGRALQGLCRLDDARQAYRAATRHAGQDAARQAAELYVESYVEQGDLSAARLAERDVWRAGFRSPQLDALRAALGSGAPAPPPRCPPPATAE